MTVFISEPETYEGGELIIRAADQEMRIKEVAGRAILYPSTYYHRVAPVTAGARIVAITFIESAFRDAAKREILVELQEFLHENAAKVGPAAQLRLEYVKSNLERMWQNT
jgi:PKHD-type hydroxylase